ncbi:ankyrin repeat and LEM domain-containing protein 1 [Polyodon spathula]|uniref:ankyrin repeat and LEM domain-containing protein 1 n=1 Tax=Polyodon spathula TaxID=7913 RepID=UPI001B7E6434|nr:ankyrin repeat and LEM domain-containing protein 1 [Polyodon spathula]
MRTPERWEQKKEFAMNVNRRNLALQLCKAVCDGDPRQVEVLLKRGADPNLVSPKGVAAVHLAAGKETEKRICCLSLLLQHQADPNVRSVDDLTPLHIAALWGCYQNLHLLLQNGGDPSLVDQEGNTAADLAIQQENRKCAQILQEYLSYSQLESEQEDSPRCQFSFYRSCDGDGSFFHELVEDGVLDDSSESVLGDCPLSSTRRSLQDSDHLDLSTISARNSWGGRGSLSGQPIQQWRRGSDQGGGVASVLSSTRVSTSGRTDSQAVRLLLPVLQEDVALSDSHFQPGATDRGSVEPLHENAGGVSAVRAPPPARRKSVSFREVDEYFPACRTESPVYPGSEKDQTDSSVDTTVDFSTYSDFMDSERMVTIKKFQGLDVTSPDHVFVFCQQDNSTSPSLDKTVVEQYFPEEEEEEEEEVAVVVKVQQAADRGPPIQALTRGSSSSSSQYSSCESEYYHSVMDTSLQHRAASAEEAVEGSLANGRNSPLPLAPGVQQGSSAPGCSVMVTSPNPRSNLRFSQAGDGEAKNRSPSTGGAATRGEGSSQEEESKRDSPCVRGVSQASLSPSQATVPVQRCVAPPSLGSEEAGFREMLRNLMLSTKVPQPLPAADWPTETREDTGGEETLPHMVSISSCASSTASLRGGSDHQLVKESLISSKSSSGNRATPIGVEVAEQNSPPRSLTPSSFVTGRSKTRQSRCLLRTSSINSSTASSSCASLFEETLPTPVRLRRRERSPPGDHRGTPLQENHNGEETESETGRLGTSGEASSTGLWSRGWEGSEGAGASQADTVLIGGPGYSQASTVMIERNPYTEGNRYSAVIGTENRGSLVATVVLEESARGEDVNDVFHPKGLFQEDEVTLPNGDGTDVTGFLTDDCSSTSGEGIKIAPQEAPQCPPATDRSAQRDESWMTEDGENTRLDFAARDNPSPLYPPGPSSSSDNGRERCAAPAALPGSRVSSRCGSRYSISRLSGAPQGLHKFEANLSFTPGGRPLIMGVAEPVEFLYTDEEGHALIECHVPPTANTSMCSDTSASEETVLYDWRSFHVSPRKEKENRSPDREISPQIRRLKDGELRQRLQELGEEPGPINSMTRPIYLRRLSRLEQEHRGKDTKHNPGYSQELAACLSTFTLPDCQADMMTLCHQFDQPDLSRKWREGVVKSSFNYLLLDPRVTKNLPFRSSTISPAERFETFVRAVFYVGKGKRSRPYSHLYEALEYYKGDKTSKKLCSKVQHILQVWAAGQGVISLHCFQNVIPVEAYTREACMVDAIGLKMLTNQKKGDYYGVVATWPMKRRRLLGVHLLHSAMHIFLAEGERQLRPTDIRAGQ